MKEEWKEVFGFDILFEVSNMGKVRTKHHGKTGYQKEYRFIAQADNGSGYLRINIPQSGKQKTIYIHKLVAEAFISNPEALSEVNHIDENKSNNRADNLEWCSHKYNCQYGTRNQKVSQKNRKRVVCNETKIVFESLGEAAKAFDVCDTAIANCLKGRSKTCAGHTWSYADV